MEEANDASVTIVSSESTTPVMILAWGAPAQVALTYFCVAISSVYNFAKPGPILV